ncbi:ATP synthase F0 subunit B [Paracidobacterium acidisoli]|uniref:ATP synthase subunit b n=1 Tax=Paracidobacterium acidisoli TaxID=2303751 RepID=A0A372IKI2_9BACT|nr:ATP synthase F0 subunit B [Paracidobacterium acidisoli]MBT9332834.1 ATP synthase F0 subunit B [Paracidobacterium acidisoli]
MKRIFRTVFFSLIALAFTSAGLHAQNGAPAPASAPAGQKPAHAAQGPHMEDQVSHGEWEEFRHSAAVQAIARYGHVDTETAAKIFEDFNSGVMILAILAFLLKVLPKAFRKRSETLQKELTDARTAGDEANRRLSAVEARLAKLDDEIEAIRQQTEIEAGEDEKRIHALLETERERIVQSAGHEIELAQEAAQRELKRFAANLAIDRATQRIRLTPEADQALLDGIGEDLATHFSGRNMGGRN